MNRRHWRRHDERVRRNALEEQESVEPQIGARPLPDRRFYAITGGIVAVALLLRIYRIGEQPLRFDEAFSFSMAAMPHWLERALGDVNPPLYYLLLRGWVQFAGLSEAALRLPSAVFGALFVAGVIWAGRTILTPQVGLWSGAFAAVAPIHIYYSQEARAYTLLTLALLLTYVTLWRALKATTWHSWAPVSACAVVALYSHYFAILGLLPTAFLLLIWPEKQQTRERWLRYAGAGLLSGLLMLPWLLWSFVFRPHSLQAIEWIRSRWDQMERALAIPRSLEVLGLGWTQVAGTEFASSLRMLGLFVLLALGVWVVSPGGDSRLGVPWLGKRKAWLLMLLVVPLLTLWLVSFYTPVYVIGRYDNVAFPAYALLLGLALGKLQRIPKTGTTLASVTALLLMIPIGTKLVLHYQAPAKRPAQETATALHASVEDGDIVVFTAWSGLEVLYSLTRLHYRCEDTQCRNELTGRSFSCRFFPRDMERVYFAARANNPNRALGSSELIQEDVRDYLSHLGSPRGSVWLVLPQRPDPRGRIVVPMRVARLLAELGTSGFTDVQQVDAPGIIHLRRS
jgi:4-amino-4-deoxy-L-arabinose transferase-like glycosyltransferase